MYLLYMLVDGTSDDLDIPIKKVFSDTEYVSRHNLCSINSINWARIMVQVFLYLLFILGETHNILYILI